MFAVRGEDRFVLVFPTLGIVMKFPVIWLYRTLDLILTEVEKGRYGVLKYVCTKWAPECRYVVSGMLLCGIIANQRERALSKRARNSFPQPTLFSFFGLVNIQKFGKPCSGNYLDLWLQVRKITKESAYRNPHQFSMPCNYTIVDGKLRILDYGGHGSSWVVLKYGEKIVNEFDPKFHYTGK
jgi:hypothetical protein